MEDKERIGPDSVVARVEGLVSTDMDGETVLLSVESGNYYGMDQVGSRIWALIESPRTVAGLCQALLEEYDVGPERCEKDVLHYLNALAKENLVKISHEPTG